MKAHTTAICVALGLALSPVAAYTAGDKDAKKESVTQKAKEAIDDATITTKIKAEFAKDKQVSAMKIHVDTDKGVVKLTGTAKSPAEADKAVTIAKKVKGVSSVHNEIKIGKS